MTDLTADEIRALPKHAVIIRHDPDEGPIAYQRISDTYWGGTVAHYGLDVDGICWGINAYLDKYTLAWTPEAES